MQFFPEGGNLLSGISSKIAIKAENYNGVPLKINGKITDNQNNTVSEFATNSLGYASIELKPYFKNTYYAVGRDENGKKYKFKLTKVRVNGRISNIANEGLLIAEKSHLNPWDKIINKTWNEPSFTFENYLEVTGVLNYSMIKSVAKNETVRLTILNEYNDVYKTSSNEDGKFKFMGLKYFADSLLLIAECFNEEGDKKRIITIENLKQKPNYSQFIRNVDEFLDFYKKAKTQIKGVPKYNKQREQYHNFADYVLYMEDYDLRAYQNVAQFLSGRIPGLRFVDESPQRVVSGSHSGTLFLQDNTPVSSSIIYNIAPADLTRIEIMRPPSAYYGQRGYYGVIALYTNKGDFIKRGELEFIMSGYCPKKTFEMDTNDYPVSEKTVYWTANINTNEEGKAQIVFPELEDVAQYTISVEGVSDQGLLSKHKSFEY